MSEFNPLPEFVGMLPRTIKLAERVIKLLEHGLTGDRDGDWVLLDAKDATLATEDIGRLKQEAMKVRLALEPANDIATTKVAFLDRVENILEYTGATICLNADGKADAHAGRASSSVRQLRGLIQQAREHALSVLASPAKP